MNKEILNKIDVGDHLTDNELSMAVDWFADLEGKLALLGQPYSLAWAPVHARLTALRQALHFRMVAHANRD